MERRFLAGLPAGLMLRDDASGISGYAAIYYNGTPQTEYQLYPGVFERIMPGAFSRAVNQKDDARALVNHDPNMLLGRVSAGTLRLTEDNVGLRYEISPSDTTIYRDAAENIRLRNLQGSSFAFTVTDEQPRKENGVRIREIRGVELFDVGPVTYPAYEATSTGVRMAGNVEDVLKIFEKLDMLERSRVAAITKARLISL